MGQDQPGVLGEQAARAENQKALADFPELYAQHADFVRRAVIRLGGPRADADDLVQDVFVAAMKSASRFEGRSSPRTWLYGIAINIVSRARRRARLRELFSLRPPEESREPPTPQVLFEHKESSRIVYALLDKIAEKKRTVFILYELEGLSAEEIAELVRCPRNTVWTRLHHARQEFHAHLLKHQLRAERELSAKGRS